VLKELFATVSVYLIGACRCCQSGIANSDVIHVKTLSELQRIAVVAGLLTMAGIRAVASAFDLFGRKCREAIDLVEGHLDIECREE
jgi:hypothetical protein